MGAHAAIHTERLSKSFGAQRAVVDLDLDVRPGEVFGYLGPNGAGKTTTIRMLLGLLQATGGRAQVLGFDVARQGPQARARMGYLNGDLALWERLTGQQLLDYLDRLRGESDRAWRAQLAERFDVDLHRPIHELSRGNKQKIGLVQAFAHRPRVLVLDEPTSGLDPLVQHAFHDLVRAWVDAGGTVFLSSHVIDEVQRTADRVGILRAGRLVIVEDVGELRAKALRRVDVHFATAPPPGSFDRVPGVRSIDASGDTLVFAVEGSLDHLIKALAQHEVLDVTSRQADLEEVFLTYYRDEVASPDDAAAGVPAGPTTATAIPEAATGFAVPDSPAALDGEEVCR